MIVKNGLKGAKQLHKCKACGRQFVGGNRLDTAQIVREYVIGKQTLEQLSVRYGCRKETIWRRLQSFQMEPHVPFGGHVVVLVDATYWGRNFGVVLFREANQGKILWYKFIHSHEHLADYREGYEWLLSRGVIVDGVVCDGISGLSNLFGDTPVQMCHFHMKAIIRKHLTQRPKLLASQELLDIVKSLKDSDKEDFSRQLDAWYDKWNTFINERSMGNDSKTHYTHKSLRAAYKSLVRHLPRLWTYKEYPERNIPNTNAGIESFNSQLKTTLRVHSGITKEQRMKLIELYIIMNG